MELISRHICKAQNMGVHGNLFGGNMLAWLDEAGAMYARMKANSGSMVTLYMGDHMFKEPVKMDEQVEIFGEVLKRGNTSIKIKLVAEKITLKTGERKVVTETQMVFVRIDEGGNKKPIDWPDPVQINESLREKMKKESPVKMALDIPDEEKREKALNEMTRLAQEMGLYDQEGEE